MLILLLTMLCIYMSPANLISATYTNNHVYFAILVKAYI